MDERPVAIAPHGPFDFPWLVRFLAARAAPALESVSMAGVRRAVHIHGRPVLLTVRPEPSGERPEAFSISSEAMDRAPGAAVPGPSLPAGDGPASLSRRMLDLDGDLTAFHRMAANDALLAPLVAARPGIRLPQIPDPFEALVRAILGQQVSVAAARTMTDRLVRLLGDPVPRGFRAFPTAAAVAAVTAGTLAGLGLTGAKARAIRGVADAVARGDVDWRRLGAGSFEDAVAELCTLPGVGPWTAAYVRMRGLGDHDAFPATDLGVIKAVRRLVPGGDGLTVRQIAEIAERWKPWRGYATVHLWSANG